MSPKIIGQGRHHASIELRSKIELKPIKVQILIASDKMDVSNGSTEVVPCSHLMTNLDVAIHDKGQESFYDFSTDNTWYFQMCIRHLSRCLSMYRSTKATF